MEKTVDQINVAKVGEPEPPTRVRMHYLYSVESMKVNHGENAKGEFLAPPGYRLSHVLHLNSAKSALMNKEGKYDLTHLVMSVYEIAMVETVVEDKRAN